MYLTSRYYILDLPDLQLLYSWLTWPPVIIFLTYLTSGYYILDLHDLQVLYSWPIWPPGILFLTYLTCRYFNLHLPDLRYYILDLPDLQVLYSWPALPPGNIFVLLVPDPKVKTLYKDFLDLHDLKVVIYIYFLSIYLSYLTFKTL